MADSTEDLALRTGPLRDERGHWLKGQHGGGVRQKGKPNKHTTAIKQIIEDVYVGLGGLEAMIAWARENPNLFYATVLPRLIPMQMRLDATVQTDFAGILEQARQRVINAPSSSHDDD